MTMGQTSGLRRAVAVAAISLVFSVPLAGCRKLGMDESPRHFPAGGDPSSLGPKRAPVNQNSALPPAVAPQAAAQPQPQPQYAMPAEAYDAAGGNFWASNAGWTASPPAMSTGAAPPKPQPAPLPPLDLLRRQPAQFSAQAMPPSRYAGNPEYAAQSQPAPSPFMPVQSPYPTGYSAPPQPMQQAMGGDFPSLREIPGQPYYRDPNEIAADFASLQTDSRMASGYAAPAPQASYSYNSGYPQQDYGSYAPAPAAPAPSYETPYPVASAAPLPPALPGYPGGGYGALPAALPDTTFYGASEFVQPAPVAGVPDAPAMTRDWDNAAYRSGGGSAYAPANAAIALRAPYGGQQPFLPESRYTGQRRAPLGYRY